MFPILLDIHNNLFFQALEQLFWCFNHLWYVNKVVCGRVIMEDYISKLCMTDIYNEICIFQLTIMDLHGILYPVCDGQVT